MKAVRVAEVNVIVGAVVVVAAEAKEESNLAADLEADLEAEVVAVADTIGATGCSLLTTGF